MPSPKDAQTSHVRRPYKKATKPHGIPANSPAKVLANSQNQPPEMEGKMSTYDLSPRQSSHPPLSSGPTSNTVGKRQASPAVPCATSWSTQTLKDNGGYVLSNEW